MANPDYFVAFDHHTDSSLAEFSSTLMKCPKKPVGTVQLSELCSMADYPYGIYLFFDAHNEPWYVGKATSRSFVERVPSHFVQREDAWFNTLPKRIKATCGIGDYSEALKLALSLQLVLIGVQETRTAMKLEEVLRTYLKPKLNAASKLSYRGTELMSSFAVRDPR